MASITGTATYFDGIRPTPRPVEVRLDAVGLTITDTGGLRLALWPLAEIRRVDSHGAVLRLTHARPDRDERLDITDPALSAAVNASAIPVNGSWSRATRNRVAILSVLAVVSLVWLIRYGVPALGGAIAATLPVSTEQRIGESVRPQILKMLGDGTEPPKCTHPDGLAALAALTGPIIKVAQAQVPVEVEVIKLPLPNAFALPGGKIIITSGLLKLASSPNHVAAVFAHEMGHVYHRDGLRRLGEVTGISFIFGALLGDFTGSTLAIAIAQGLIDASYSREAETRADAFSVKLMTALERDPAQLADALDEITRDREGLPGILNWFSTHPDTPARVKALRAGGATALGLGRAPMISAEQWRVLKAICN